MLQILPFQFHSLTHSLAHTQIGIDNFLTAKRQEICAGFIFKCAREKEEQLSNWRRFNAEWFACVRWNWRSSQFVMKLFSLYGIHIEMRGAEEELDLISVNRRSIRKFMNLFKCLISRRISRFVEEMNAIIKSFILSIPTCTIVWCRV
jgi:hypothetical protein